MHTFWNFSSSFKTSDHLKTFVTIIRYILSLPASFYYVFNHFCDAIQYSHLCVQFPLFTYHNEVFDEHMHRNQTVHSLVLSLTHTRARIHRHARKQAHTHMHTHTHTHARTHTNNMVQYWLVPRKPDTDMIRCHYECTIWKNNWLLHSHWYVWAAYGITIQRVVFLLDTPTDKWRDIGCFRLLNNWFWEARKHTYRRDYIDKSNHIFATDNINILSFCFIMINMLIQEKGKLWKPCKKWRIILEGSREKRFAQVIESNMWNNMGY